MTTQNENGFRKYVDPVYLSLMGTLILSEPAEEQEKFKQKITAILADPDLTDEMLKLLLWNSDWRCSLVGAWLIFIKNKTAFVDDIGKFLLQHKGGVIGYCFALAKFGTSACVEYLVSYLGKDLYFEKFPDEGFQDTAMYALVYIDNKSKTTFSKPFFEPDGLWTKFIECKYLKEHRLKDSARWGQFDENYKNFAGMFEFMDTFSTKG